MISKKYNCKTNDSFEDPKIYIKKIKNNFGIFENYKQYIRSLYFKEFKEKIELFELKDINNAFEKKMPYISGKRKITNISIQFPKNQFIMNHIFNDIIKIINFEKVFPLNNEYGLAYFNEQEWIFFTIDEVNYQNYISNSEKIMSLFYKNYMDNKIETNSLFSEEDKYILPSYVRGYNFETNIFNYFYLKINLPTAPDLLIKLKNDNIKNDNFDEDENTKNNQNSNKQIYFDDYINEIKNNFDYLQTDGTFINSNNKEIEIKEIEYEILTYQCLNNA